MHSFRYCFITIKSVCNFCHFFELVASWGKTKVQQLIRSRNTDTSYGWTEADNAAFSARKDTMKRRKSIHLYARRFLSLQVFERALWKCAVFPIYNWWKLSLSDLIPCVSHLKISGITGTPNGCRRAWNHKHICVKYTVYNMYLNLHEGILAR